MPKITVGEFDLSDKKTDFNKLRANVGMVFQYPEYQLFAETVFEDVAFGYRNFYPSASEEEVRAAVFGALSLVGLGAEVADKSPFELSGGQKRRAAIAGVVITEPEVLILDEPLAGLDPIGKRELVELLKALGKGATKTIVVVSHDMDDVAEHCSDVAVFSNGRVIALGSPKEVFSNVDDLAALGLDFPTTAKLSKALAERGIVVDSDLTTDDFVSKCAELYKKVQ